MDKTVEACRLTRLHSTDFDQVSTILSGPHQRVEQVGKGAFEGTIETAAVPGIRLSRIRVNRRILSRGAPPPGQFIFSPVGHRLPDTLFRGNRLRPGCLNVVAAGDEIEHRTGSQYDNILLFVDRNIVERASRRVAGRAIEESLRGIVGLPVDPFACHELEEFLRRTLVSLHSTSPDPGRTLEACVEGVARLLAASDNRIEDWRRESNPHLVVRRAEEMMRAATDGSLTTASLCQKLDISERTLRNAFRETKDASPMAYYKVLRLNGVHRELRAGGTTVRAAGMRWGFIHPGEFAADYLGLFGEKPSATLQG